ncbi:MAG TPA: magnesium/cobalt transporter CorA [Candidatus Eisenbacteria bacterium]|nr:magnesium/cobalt transporter CorA [Candidatus Eisenbacteria bacterium]
MLINCVAYRNGRRVREIPVNEIHEYLKEPDAFVWVALKDPEPSELEEMQRQFGLHELAVEDARHGHQRPKLEEYGDSLFVVLHMIEAEAGELNVGELAIFAGNNYLLSVRRGAKRGFVDVRTRCEREPELLRHGPGYVLYALMDAVVDRYFPIIDGLETELEAIEEQIFANETTAVDIIEALYDLRRKLMTVRHATEPLLEATGRLYAGRVPQLVAGLQDYFRDVYDHLIRLNQAVDSLRDMTATAISVNLSLVTIQENQVTKRLAAYGALVAVPTMIAGIYGMNFQYMPELNWWFGYPFAIGLMVVLDAYLFYRFRKAKWL